MGRKQECSKKSKKCVTKVVTVVEYWKGLPKSKQSGQGKPGNNTNNDYLWLSHKDILVPP